MSSKNITTILLIAALGPFFWVLDSMSDDLDSIKLSYAECPTGILESDMTIALSLGENIEVVHSIREATDFLHRSKGEARVSVFMPNMTKIDMEEGFCDKPQPEKDEALVEAIVHRNMYN